jgi:hypothetical protein
MTVGRQVPRVPGPRRARGRAAAACVVTGVVAVATVLVTAGAPTASATPVRDRDPGTAAVIVQRLSDTDATLRTAVLQLPTAETAVVMATLGVGAARAEEQRVRAAGPPAPATSSGGAADSVATAILAELAPEGATAARVRAAQALAVAVAQRDALRAKSTDAAATRVTLFAALVQSGARRTSWSVQLLDRLGAPVTTENVRGLAAWIEAEFNRADLDNPLATTMGAPGARDANDHGVKAYPSEATGLDATVRTLRNGLYDGILAAMTIGDSALRLARAVAASPWGTGENAVRRLAMER